MIGDLDVDSIINGSDKRTATGSQNDFDIMSDSSELMKALVKRDEKVLLDLMQVRDKIRLNGGLDSENNQRNGQANFNEPWLASASTSSEVLRNETLSNLAKALKGETSALED